MLLIPRQSKLKGLCVTTLSMCLVHMSRKRNFTVTDEPITMKLYTVLLYESGRPEDESENTT